MEEQMIKTEEKAKVRSMRTSNSTDTEIALLKKDIETIRDNHLHHLKEDVDRVEKKVDKIDARIWWILGLLVASVLGPMLAKLFV